MLVTIYHNPKCSKSRETLTLIQQAGISPIIVEYLNQPLPAETIHKLLNESGLTALQAMRTDTEAYQQFVAGKQLTETELVSLLVQHPSLLNRPFVTSEKGTKLCRPPELVKTLL